MDHWMAFLPINHNDFELIGVINK